MRAPIAAARRRGNGRQRNGLPRGRRGRSKHRRNGRQRPPRSVRLGVKHHANRRKLPNNASTAYIGAYIGHERPAGGMTRNSLPSRDELLAFIREHSGNVGTREIARAFGAKNADRAELKRMLRDLTEGGHIDRRRKKLHRPGILPPVVLADVTGRDSDGELLARPTEWDEEAHGEPPIIYIVTARRPKPGEVAGVGDRVLLR